MSEKRAFMDRLEDFDETTEEGFAACTRVLCEGLNFYKQGILNAVNAAPGVDRPIAVAAMKVIYETVMANDEELREVTRAVLSLPLAAMVINKGGAEDGEV